MRVVFTPLTPELIPACRDFNERLSRGGEPPFTLPEKLANEVAGTDGYSSRHYVAVDDGGLVRGGVLLTESRGWVNQAVVKVINIQSPISEGIVDRKYSGIGLQMLKFIAARSPYSYAVGMGSEQNPLPRLLKAAGWSLRAVPFWFAVIRPAQFLREMGPLRHGRKRWAARMAAASGVGAVVLGIWRMAHPQPDVRAYSLDDVTDSWPKEADAIWEQCRTRLSFSLVRDSAALSELYPNTQPRLKRFLLRERGEIVGWSVGVVTKMKNDRNFGDLNVGTILDGLATQEHCRVLAALTSRALRDSGADLIVTNQARTDWNVELRKLGYLHGPSNYILALSKPLAEALRSEPSSLDRIHVNRGDGDGRIHV